MKIQVGIMVISRKKFMSILENYGLAASKKDNFFRDSPMQNDEHTKFETNSVRRIIIFNEVKVYSFPEENS
jgi:hypothetical protein